MAPLHGLERREWFVVRTTRPQDVADATDTQARGLPYRGDIRLWRGETVACREWGYSLYSSPYYRLWWRFFFRPRKPLTIAA